MKKILIGVALVLVVGGVAAWLLLDNAVVKAVEVGGERALGVKTGVGSASVKPFGGRVELADLRIANPPGYEKPNFLELDRIEVHADTGSLLSDKVEVRTIDITGLEVDIERGKGGTNVSKLMESLKKLKGKPKKGEPEAEEGGGKKLVIGELVLRDVRVHSHLLPELGQVADATLAIPEIRLTDLGGDDGLTVAQVVAKVVEAILASAVQLGGGIFSGEILNDLKNSLENLGEGVFEGLTQELGPSLQKIGESAADAAKGLGKTLEGVFKK